jgi:hypothetical protein
MKLLSLLSTAAWKGYRVKGVCDRNCHHANTLMSCRHWPVEGLVGRAFIAVVAFTAATGTYGATATAALKGRILVGVWGVYTIATAQFGVGVEEVLEGAWGARWEAGSHAHEMAAAPEA